MKIVACICLILGMSLAASAQAPEPTDISGAWKLTMDTPMGQITSDLTIKLDGDKITATLTSERGSLEMTGTLTEETLTFTGDANGFTLTFSGKPNPKAMSGQVDFGGMGNAAWSAVRPG